MLKIRWYKWNNKNINNWWKQENCIKDKNNNKLTNRAYPNNNPNNPLKFLNNNSNNYLNFYGNTNKEKVNYSKKCKN
jgi:hypothetical protein